VVAASCFTGTGLICFRGADDEKSSNPLGVSHLNKQRLVELSTGCHAL
jgi:hypothetical protein